MSDPARRHSHPRATLPSTSPHGQVCSPDLPATATTTSLRTLSGPSRGRFDQPETSPVSGLQSACFGRPLGLLRPVSLPHLCPTESTIRYQSSFSHGDGQPPVRSMCEDGCLRASCLGHRGGYSTIEACSDGGSATLAISARACRGNHTRPGAAGREIIVMRSCSIAPGRSSGFARPCGVFRGGSLAVHEEGVCLRG
jgi:hypothetical protein